MPISVSKWNVGLREGKWGNVLVSLQDLLVDWSFFFFFVVYGILVQCCQMLRHLTCHFLSSVVQQDIVTLFHKLD